MRIHADPSSCSGFFRCAIPRGCVAAAMLIGSLALGGCGESEPQGDALEAIRAQQLEGKYRETLDALREYLATHPDDGEANFMYGRALAVTRPHLALWSLRKAMLDPDWFVQAGTQLALVSLSARDFPEVVEITTRILERAPDNLRVLMMRANAYAHSKTDPELAIEDAQRMLEIEPKYVEAYEPLILALLDLDRFDEAKARLEESGRVLEELDREDAVLAWHCATRATFEQESDEPEGARQIWRDCLAGHPMSPDVVTSAMGFFDAMGEPAESLEILRVALAGAPAPAAARYFRLSLAQRLAATGDIAGAEAVLREQTDAAEPAAAAAAWLDLGKLRKATGDYQASADALGKSVELARQAGKPDPQSLFEYADALVLANQLDLALEVSKELTVPAYAHLIRGRVAQDRRDPRLALKEFDQGLSLWPDNPWARYHAALAAEELGDFARALEEFRNAVRMGPGSTDARMRGAALLAAEGDLRQAHVMLVTETDNAPLEIGGLLLAMRVSGLRGDSTSVADFLALVEASYPARAGQALAEAADGLAASLGPKMAVQMLSKAPVDFDEPRYAPAVSALVLHAHGTDDVDALRPEFEAILARHPESAAFQAIRALDLELSGASTDEIVAAYEAALALGPQSAAALIGLGRMLTRSDPDAALAYFDRAARVDPGDPAPKLGAARALVAASRPIEASTRLDLLLLDHPYVTDAASLLVELDLERGTATNQTLEHANRVVRFASGPERFDLLSRVHAQRGATGLAQEAEARARALRAASSPSDTAGSS